MNVWCQRAKLLTFSDCVCSMTFFVVMQDGYMNAKIRKLEGQFVNGQQEQTKQTSDIFKNISIFVNGYTGKCSSLLP